MIKGKFITIEGGEGAGKTTLLSGLLHKIEEQGIAVMATREPGGIPIAEQIRSVILDTANTAMDARTEALLYAAARRQHLVEKVIPALNQGQWVVCDRFLDSSLVYQGIARGLGTDEVSMINAFAIQSTMPDLTLYIDVSPTVGIGRIQQAEHRELNRLDLEQMSFHEKVREGYLQLASQYPNRIVTINGEQQQADVLRAVITELEARFGW